MGEDISDKEVLRIGKEKESIRKYCLVFTDAIIIRWFKTAKKKVEELQRLDDWAIDLIWEDKICDQCQWSPLQPKVGRGKNQ